MANTNEIMNAFFGVSGLEKITVNESSNIYKKESFNKFMCDTFPQYVEGGIIPSSKYEGVAKKARKKLRLLLLQVLETFQAQKSEENRKIFAMQFAKFYSEYYIVNDYTLASVTNGRMKQDSIDIIQKTLPQLKMLLEQQATQKQQATNEKKKK